MRGTRAGFAAARSSVGNRFRVVPLAHLKLGADDPRRDFDLNADIAAALLDVGRTTLWRFTRHGRPGVDGVTRTLPAFYPYGANAPHSRAYYRLEDLEHFAAAAWKTPRPVVYEIIPHWYAVKHNRNDLIAEGRVRPAPKAPAPSPRTAGLPPDERAAVEAGWPRGSYLEGDNVFTLEGIQLNPGPLDSAEMHALAARELARLKITEENT